MSLLPKTNVGSIFSTPLKNKNYPFVCGPQRLLLTVLFHGRTKQDVGCSGGDTIFISSICDSLRRGCNWESLSRKFLSFEFSDSVVGKVLLELKEPVHAKMCLGFFHWLAKEKNFVHGVRSYCLMIHILVRARLVLDAQALIESVLKKNGTDGRSKFLVVDSLISSYGDVGSCRFVFDLLVQAYAKLRMFEIGFDVCGYLEEHGFSLSITSFNTLIHVVQRSERTSSVWKIYEHMVQRRVYPNQATISILINALCKEGELQKIIDMLDKIHGSRCTPSIIVNTSLVFRIIEDGRIDTAMALLKLMLQKNMVLDAVGYSLIVYGKLKLGNLDSAFQVYEEMQRRGFCPNSFLYTSFVGAFCKDGRIEEAKQLLQEMKIFNLKSYDETFNFLIEGCAKAGRIGESLNYCDMMMDRGLVPSLSTFNCLLQSLDEISQVQNANTMLTRLLDKGFLPNELTYTYIISGYERHNLIEEGVKLYYEMQHRSLSPGLPVFTCLIRGLCHHGRLRDAEKYLRIMKDRSIEPSEDIYEAVKALIAGHHETNCFIT